MVIYGGDPVVSLEQACFSIAEDNTREALVFSPMSEDCVKNVTRFLLLGKKARVYNYIELLRDLQVLGQIGFWVWERV